MVLLPPRVSTITKIYKHYEDSARESPVRPHLGASEIGKECERQIWYSFRWALKKGFSGRILRLFETGQLEEGRIIANLTATGVDVHAFDLKTGRQYRVAMLGGHFAGSLDGIAQGLVEAPKTWHLAEYKTHNDKSFKALLKFGLAKSKPEHLTQMQTYMGMSHEGFGGTALPALSRGLYLAVNKNDDELYMERVEYDATEYLKIKEKARRIIFNPRPPAKISENKDAFVCKFCNYKDLCHGTPLEFEKPLKNCRTCLYSTPQADGTWLCEKFDKTLCLDEQVQGCEKHLYIPELLPYKQVDVGDGAVAYSNGESLVTNHEGGELVAAPKEQKNTEQSLANFSKDKLPWE